MRRTTNSNDHYAPAGFDRIARAADRAAADVLREDEALRQFGIFPPNGRSR